MIRSIIEPIIRAQINNVVTQPASHLMPIPEIENDRPKGAIRKLQTQIFYLVDVIVALQERFNSHLSIAHVHEESAYIYRDSRELFGGHTKFCLPGRSWSPRRGAAT